MQVTPVPGRRPVNVMAGNSPRGRKGLSPAKDLTLFYFFSAPQPYCKKRGFELQWAGIR